MVKVIYDTSYTCTCTLLYIVKLCQWFPNTCTSYIHWRQINHSIAKLLQGVIFGIHFREESRLLCSVSDDRSMRLWRCVLDKEVSGRLSVQNWSCATFQLINVMYGHSARVWNSCILKDCIVSVGEVGIFFMCLSSTR